MKDCILRANMGQSPNGPKKPIGFQRGTRIKKGSIESKEMPQNGSLEPKKAK